MEYLILCMEEENLTTTDYKMYAEQCDMIRQPISGAKKGLKNIENFIDEEECQAMADEAAKTLHRATVADGKGGSRLSENRKAMQAGITVNWKKEDEGDPIARISRRVYDYTEHVLGLGIKENGQEDLMSIQYFGRGRNDTEPDRYTPVSRGFFFHVVILLLMSQFIGPSN